ncbi:MAG: N-6 DNA methylase [Planctomycetaceae bacterium]|jgi:type I restriction-modification system DNA methylase subunit|nr:N-6 DNA methylase [Planctomycetaceae bacterium]
MSLNNTQKFFNATILDKTESNDTDLANEIGISDATLRNWRRLGISEKEHGKKLRSRANKRQSQRKFKPDEYSDNETVLREIDIYIDYVAKNNISMPVALYLAASNIVELKNNPIFQREMESWHQEIGNIPKQHLDWFLKHKLNIANGDILGLFYQTLLTEGQKAVAGSYYTPSSIVREIVKEYLTVQSKVLDPACGTGQFLLEAANIVADPNLLYGIDLDPLAVRLCRLNIMCKFPNKIFEPKIYCADTLSDFHKSTLLEIHNTEVPTNYFDLVMTNPPWGGHLNPQRKAALSKQFPQIISGETFSYFLIQASRFAKEGKYVSFLLPEAILNIKVHEDIRQFLCSTTQILNVTNLGRVFSGVFTPVIRLDYCNKPPKQKQNAKQIFAVHQTSNDRCLLEKIDSFPQTTLKNRAQFALGIVTGNNEKHLLTSPESGSEPIFRGKDVEPFVLNQNKEYLIFAPEQFQQVAKENFYRVEEKLIYRFICKDIVFAYDDQKRLTLNSANILIPEIPNYPIKALVAVLNSDAIRFVYRKRFNTIKVLRGNLEDLPLPVLSDCEKNELITLADNFIQTRSVDLITNINQIIFRHYNLNDDEIKYITEFLKTA